MCTLDLNCRKVRHLKLMPGSEVAPRMMTDNSRKAQVSFMEGDEMHER